MKTFLILVTLLSLQSCATYVAHQARVLEVASMLPEQKPCQNIRNDTQVNFEVGGCYIFKDYIPHVTTEYKGKLVHYSKKNNAYWMTRGGSIQNTMFIFDRYDNGTMYFGEK